MTAARHGTALALALGIVAMIGLTGCGRSDEASAGPPPTSSGPLVVTRGDLRDQVLITGELEAVLSDKLVVPQTRAWNLSIRWMEEDGAEVEAGQKLLEFDNSSVVSTLDDAEIARTGAENDLRSQAASNELETSAKAFAVDKARLELEKARLRAAVPEEAYGLREYQERQLALHRAQVDLARAEDELTAQRKAAALELALKRIALDKMTREIRAAEQMLESLVLTAPRDGILVVGEHPWEGRKFQVGDTTWPGIVVLELPDVSSMQVEATLSDVDDGRVAEGMAAVCTLDAYPTQQLPGAVKTLTPVAQESARESLRRTFHVVVELAGPGREGMLPGMSVQVDIAGRHVEGALLAPRAGLELTNQPRARLDGGGEVEIEVGWCTADTCEIKAGLAEGARLRRGGEG